MSPPSSSVAWHLSALPLPARSLLLDALELPDVVRLLSCSRALRNDHETAALALRGYDISRHFGRGCTLDWCLPVPAYLLSNDETQESCALDHADELPLAFERGGDTCVKLLSLTGQMGYALDEVLYRSFAVDTVAYTVLPFIWPTALDESSEAQPETELDAQSDLADHLNGLHLRAQAKQTEAAGGSRRVTPLALHFENIELSPGSPHALCKFCQMVEERVDTYTLEGFAYLLHRDTTVTATAGQLRAQGHGEDSAEWAAAVAHFERLDALYDQNVVDEEDAPEIMRRLIECDELPTLRGMEALARDAADDNDDGNDDDGGGGESELLAVGDAVGDAAHADFTDRACRELCVPLRQFFETGGFRDVRHETVENSIFASVERIAGTAPCGFAAGVMIAGVGTVAY